MKYFAYGTNCSVGEMEKKGLPFAQRRRAALSGYRLRFNKKSFREALPDCIGFANIELESDSTVEGILYDMDDQLLQRLDELERCPDQYQRIEVSVETSKGRCPCWTYQAQPDKTAEGLVPSRNYLNYMLTAKDFLSHQYYEGLDQTQTYEGECACCHKSAEAIFIREQDTLYMLCQPCREARLTWGDVRGRKLTVGETEAVMNQLVLGREGFTSVQELISRAVERKIITP